MDREEKKKKRQEILDRLNSHDAGPNKGAGQSQQKKELEGEKALGKGRRGLGWVGGMGGGM